MKDVEIIGWSSNVEAIIFYPQNSKTWHTYVMDSFTIKKSNITEINNHDIVELHMNYKLGSPKLSKLNKRLVNYDNGYMEIIVRNRVYKINDFYFKQELEGSIVFEVCGLISKEDRDYNKYPSRKKSNEDIKIEKLNVELNKKDNKNKGIKIKRITKSEQILRELDFGRGMTTDILIDSIKEFDNIIPGRYEGYLVSKGKEEMFYSDIFVENLLRKEFNKYLDDGKVVI
ncbi:hypothetical protein HCG68_00115 [Paeniclostridium sordellii]|nr:hypothetical protein [Paeniclostridium sordellii]